MLTKLWYFHVRVFFLVIVGLHASVLDLALGQQGKLPIPATLLALLSFSTLAVLSVLSDLLRPTRDSIALGALKNNYFAQAPYILLACVSLLWSLLPGSYWNEGPKWILLITYGFAISTSASLGGLHPALNGRIRNFFQLPLAMLLCSIFWELAHPAYFSTEEARPAGFAGNSNFGALASNMLLAAVLRYQGRKSVARDGFWLLATATAVFVTQSRSGLIGFGVVLAAYLWSYIQVQRLNAVQILKFALGTVFAMVIGIAVILTVAQEAGLFKSSQTRLAKITTAGRADDGSADERMHAALDALNRISDAPVVGHGTGHTRYMPVAPHNLYLQQWMNNGLPGLLLYLSMLLGAFLLFLKQRYRPGQTFIALTAVAGLFTHNILEQHPFLIVFGTLLADGYRQHLGRQQALTRRQQMMRAPVREEAEEEFSTPGHVALP